MIKFYTLLLASFAIIDANAQKSFDTAIQQSPLTTNKEKSLFAQTAPPPVKANEMQGPAKKVMVIMPAAGTKNIKLVLTSGKAEDVTITVFDQDSNKMLNQAAHLSAGGNNIIIDNFTSLKEGNYSIQLMSNTEAYTASFLLWK